MRQLLIPCLLLALTPSARAADALDVKLDPADPQPGKLFRITALVKHPCDAIQKVNANVPASWLTISESRAKKDGGCLLVEVVSAPKEEQVAWAGFQVSVQGGATLTGGTGTLSIGKAPAAAGAPSPDKELESYLAQLQDFLASYVLGGQTDGDHFSIESCREPVVNVVKVFLGMSKGLVREYRFQPGCDMEGRGELRLDVPVLLDFKVRRLGSVDRVKGTMLVKATKGEGFQVKVESQVDEGQLLSGSTTQMKFSLTHTRSVALNMATFALNDLENEGLVTVTEFGGKAVAVKKPFTGQRFLKRAVR